MRPHEPIIMAHPGAQSYRWATATCTGAVNIDRLKSAGRTYWRAIGAGAIRTHTGLPHNRQHPGTHAKPARALNNEGDTPHNFRALDPIANFIADEIAQPLAAVAQNSQQPLVDEIGQQD